jgi:hypothetical protein
VFRYDVALSEKEVEEVMLLMKLWSLQRFLGFRGRHWDSSNDYHEHRTMRELFRYSFRYAATSFVDQSTRYLRIALVRGGAQYLAGSSGCAVSFDRSGLLKTEYSNFRSTNLRSSGLTLLVLSPILYSPSSVGGGRMSHQ